MSSNFSHYIFFVIVLLQISCTSNKFYVSEETNLLQLQEKKDLKIAASWNKLRNSKTQKFLNLQAGYSPINHLGIFVSHFRNNQQEILHDLLPILSTKNDYQFSKIAIGGYHYVDFKQERKKGILFDIYGGISRGEFDYQDEVNGGNYFLNHHKYSLQLGVHWQRPVSSFSFVWQISRMKYYEGLLSGQIERQQADTFSEIKSNPNFNLAEMTLQYTLGTKTLRGYAFTSIILNNEHIFTEAFPGIGGIGLVLDITEFAKGIRNKKNK